jgi:hypothetical protein
VSIIEAPFSDLINKPKDTIERMVRASAGLLRLRRRNDEDLVLTTASAHDQDHAVVSTASRLLTALSREESGRHLVVNVLPEVFPWVHFLPADDVRLFGEELVTTLHAAADLDTFAPVAHLIIEWRHTAEVHADPTLRGVLRQPAQDVGSVPEPDQA